MPGWNAGQSVEASTAKMANRIGQNRELQRAYTPHKTIPVRLADEAHAGPNLHAGLGEPAERRRMTLPVNRT